MAGCVRRLAVIDLLRQTNRAFTMASQGASVKLRRLRQRFGIYAPRLSIRTHVPWYWRMLSIIAIASVSLVLAAWIYDAGRQIAGYHINESTDEIRSLRNHVMELDAELTKLRSVAGTGESSLQMERAALRKLVGQVKALEAENAALREDLAFFEGLMPGGDVSDEAPVRIDRLRIEAAAGDGQFRYRLLAVNNGGRQTKEFKGNLQFLVKVRLGGKDAMITIPSSSGEAHEFRIEIKHFHRVEGVFSVPQGASVESVEARLIQDGVVRAKQSVVL